VKRFAEPAFLPVLALVFLVTPPSLAEATGPAGQSYPCDENRVSYRTVKGDHPAAQLAKEGLRLEVVKPQKVSALAGRQGEKSFSPHKSRWFSVWRDHEVGVNRGLTEVVVERAPNDFLLVSLKDVYQDGVEVHWINNKLLFVEVWWGRITATEMILDVESGSWIYQEVADYSQLSQCEDGSSKAPK
jgi:hypothetical protein